MKKKNEKKYEEYIKRQREREREREKQEKKNKV